MRRQILAAVSARGCLMSFSANWLVNSTIVIRPNRYDNE